MCEDNQIMAVLACVYICRLSPCLGAEIIYVAGMAILSFKHFTHFLSTKLSNLSHFSTFPSSSYFMPIYILISPLLSKAWLNLSCIFFSVRLSLRELAKREADNNRLIKFSSVLLYPIICTRPCHRPTWVHDHACKDSTVVGCF